MRYQPWHGAGLIVILWLQACLGTAWAVAPVPIFTDPPTRSDEKLSPSGAVPASTVLEATSAGTAYDYSMLQKLGTDLNRGQIRAAFNESMANISSGGRYEDAMQRLRTSLSAVERATVDPERGYQSGFKSYLLGQLNVLRADLASSRDAALGHERSDETVEAWARLALSHFQFARTEFSAFQVDAISRGEDAGIVSWINSMLPSVSYFESVAHAIIWVRTKEDAHLNQMKEAWQNAGEVGQEFPADQRDLREALGLDLPVDVISMREWIWLALGLGLFAVAGILVFVFAQMTHPQVQVVRVSLSFGAAFLSMWLSGAVGLQIDQKVPGGQYSLFATAALAMYALTFLMSFGGKSAKSDGGPVGANVAGGA